MSERTATDILLELEAKIDTLIKKQDNNEMLLKLLLNKLKSSSQASGFMEIASKMRPLESNVLAANESLLKEQPRQMPGLKPGIFLGPNAPKAELSKEDPEPIIQQSPLSDKDFLPSESFLDSPEEVVSAEDMVGQRRTARYPSHFANTSTVVPVPAQQRIIFASDEKNVGLANITISDLSDNVVKKTKTSAQGKWTAALVPGQYKVNISKHAVNGRGSIDTTVEINIPVSSDNVQLETVKV